MNIDKDLETKAIEFYESWYDKYGSTEVDIIERNAVIHGFISGCKYMLDIYDKNN